MRPTDLATIATWTGARAAAGRPEGFVEAVTTDSRSVPPRSLFVALRGERFDGNAFALDALARGAAAALVETGRAPAARELVDRGLEGKVVFDHPEPGRALLDLAACYRRSFAIPVAGIGGAAGKTSTKEMAAQLLARLGPVVASERSFNNAIGVPHTLLRVDDATKTAVVEIGTNAKGEVALLSAVAAPTVGIVTVIGEEHLEGLGSLEGVAEEEGDLLAALPADGTAVLNADDPHFSALRRRFSGKVVTFGIHSEADLRARDLAFHPAGATFTVAGRAARLPLIGAHNVANALGALAVARAAGLPLEDGVRALATLQGPPRRLERKRFGEIEILDDCYNANPASVRAAVAALAALRGARRRVFVLGRMHELGAHSARLHREAGRSVGSAGFDLFVAIGAEAGDLAGGAVEAGLPASRIVKFPATDDAVASVDGLLRPGDLVLVKGSRAEALERFVEAARAHFEGAAPQEARP